MESAVAQRLKELRSEYSDFTGGRCEHFFCPMLFRDEDVPLCQAHIVNQAIPNASKKWTIQRADVDNFYGSIAEADFVDLKYRDEGIAAKALLDPALERRFRPQILVDGEPVQHFAPRGNVPSRFSDVTFDLEGQQRRVGLKLTESELNVAVPGKWEIAVTKDVRVQSVISVIKAAYLTLFEMFGYRYALSPSGEFVGGLLGEFFLKYAGQDRAETLSHAVDHFETAASMVRPISPDNPDILGTIDDGLVRMCWLDDVKPPRPWGMIVLVRTGKQLHAALMPMFDEVTSGPCQRV